MKNLFTLLLVLGCFFAQAQNNPGLVITIDGKKVDNVSASFGAIMDYDVPLCGDIVPVVSKGGATPTAITKAEGCDSFFNAAAVSGKIALIRRGTCDFSLKALNAQNAGAVAVILYNRVDPANANGPIGMAGGSVGAQVTIPVAMVSLEEAQAIIASIESGKTVKACFSRPSRLINDVYGNPWGNTTPLSQVDSIYPRISYTNAKDSVAGIITYAEITDPKGVKTLLQTTDDIGVTPEGSVLIPQMDQGYLPTQKGTYQMKFFGTFLPDTTKTQFVISDFTFANDIGTLSKSGVTRAPATFATTDLKISNILNYYATGTVPSKATYVSFGLRNPARLKGRTIDISLLETDVARINAVVATTTNPGDIGDLVGDVLTYTITGNEDPDKLITIGLRDGVKKSVDLKDNTPYVVVLQYDGTAFKDSIAPEWSLGKTVPTRWPGIDAFGAALMTGASYFGGGWGDTDDPIGRLHLDAFVGTTNLAPLAAEEVSVFPNPATDRINVALNLKDASNDVQVGIMDMSGRLLEVKQLGAQQAGTFEINVKHLPVGTYFLTVKTEKGFSPEKFIKVD